MECHLLDGGRDAQSIKNGFDDKKWMTKRWTTRAGVA
jgi:hypothetical protein